MFAWLTVMAIVTRVPGQWRTVAPQKPSWCQQAVCPMDSAKMPMPRPLMPGRRGLLKPAPRRSGPRWRFDEVFRSEGIKTIHTPIRRPEANAYAEQFVRTVRTECLDWLLIVGRRHLEHVLRRYVTH
jgi:hypothetical protein